MKERNRLKEILWGGFELGFYFIIMLIIGLFFFSLLPIHDCGNCVADFSCNMWGFHN